jgi:hypothetical protein
MRTRVEEHVTTRRWRAVVAVDGSPHAQVALAWAIDQACERGGSVHVIHVWQARRPADRDDELADAENLLLAAIEAVPGRRGASISSQAIQGELLPALLRASAGADVLVLGGGGLGTSWIHQQCTEWAPCPLAVVGDAGRPQTVPRAARRRAACAAPVLRLRSAAAVGAIRG